MRLKYSRKSPKTMFRNPALRKSLQWKCGDTALISLKRSRSPSLWRPSGIIFLHLRNSVPLPRGRPCTMSSVAVHALCHISANTCSWYNPTSCRRSSGGSFNLEDGMNVVGKQGCIQRFLSPYSPLATGHRYVRPRTANHNIIYLLPLQVAMPMEKAWIWNSRKCEVTMKNNVIHIN